MVAEMPSDRDLINSQQEALLGETKRADVAIARAEAAEAALRDAQTERDEARDKVLTHTEGLLALTAERDRWRVLAEGWKRVDDVEQHRV